MPINVEYKESGNFVLAPAGQFQAVACEILDLGHSQKKYKDQKTGVEESRNVHEVQYVFQLNKVDDDTGKRFEVRSRPMNTNLSDKATLRDFLRQWRGHDLQDSEKVAPGIDLETLVGRNALISVIHNQVGDRIYANIGSIMPIVEGMPEIQALNYESKQAQVTASRAAAANGQNSSQNSSQPATQVNNVKVDDIPF